VDYTLYISNHCIACDEVLNHFNSQKIECKVTNVGSHPNLNRTIFITPALCDDMGVLAYGKDDILKVLAKAS
jgi:glutaredoxin-related protein